MEVLATNQELITHKYVVFSADIEHESSVVMEAKIDVTSCMLTYRISA